MNSVIGSAGLAYRNTAQSAMTSLRSTAEQVGDLLQSSEFQSAMTLGFAVQGVWTLLGIRSERQIKATKQGAALESGWLSLSRVQEYANYCFLIDGLRLVANQSSLAIIETAARAGTASGSGWLFLGEVAFTPNEESFTKIEWLKQKLTVIKAGCDLLASTITLLAVDVLAQPPTALLVVGQGAFYVGIGIVVGLTIVWLYENHTDISEKLANTANRVSVTVFGRPSAMLLPLH